MCFHLPLQGGGSRLRLDLAFLSGSELGLASGFFISLALGFRSFCCSFAFSFGLGLGGRCLSLCRYSFFVLGCAASARASSENWTVCRAVETICFLSAFLARAFSAISRLP